MILLYLWAVGSAFGAGADWWSIASLRSGIDAPGAKAVAHWAGPDPSRPEAAFLALHLPESGVRCIVAAKDGLRVRFDKKLHLDSPAKAEAVTSLDVEGVHTPAWVILFHTEAGLLRSAFSFDTGKTGGKLKFLIAPVAPGVWEVWHDGWVVDPGVVVRAGEGVLYFTGGPGSYFVRKLN